MKTEEAKVKDKFKAFLYERRVASLAKPMQGAVGHYHMAVPMGLGSPTIDFTGCYRTFYWGVETKKPGTEPTPRQYEIMGQMSAAGAFVRWSDSADDLIRTFNWWFDYVDKLSMDINFEATGWSVHRGLCTRDD